MKYSERDELVSSLRELADFIEDNGLELPALSINAQGWVYDYNPRTFKKDEQRPRRIMRRAALALGKAEKRHTGSYFDLIRKFGSITLEITTSRQAVCERIVTAVVDMPEQVIPAYKKEVVDWICGDPLLRAEA